MSDPDKLTQIIEDLSLAMQGLSCVQGNVNDLLEIAKENSARLARIELWLRNPSAAARQVEADQQRENEAIAMTFECPQCRGEMIARVGRMREYFAGCAAFPKCKGSRSMNGVDTTPRPKRLYNMDGVKTLHESSEHAP